MSSLPSVLVLLVALCGSFVPTAGHAAMANIYPNDYLNDYPTAARADYVFACMATNGNTQEALHRCSCAIDVIASILPYSKYEEAETVLRMRQHVGGHLGEAFRSGVTNDMVRNLEEAQAEGEVRCF